MQHRVYFQFCSNPIPPNPILSAMIIMTMTRKIERIDLTLKNGAGSSYQKAFSKTSRDGHLISSRLNGTYLAGGVGGKVEEGRRLKFLG